MSILSEFLDKGLNHKKDLPGDFTKTPYFLIVVILSEFLDKLPGLMYDN